MNDLFVLLKVSVCHHYKVLFSKINDYSSKINDQYLLSAIKWISSYLTENKKFPDIVYFLEKFPVFSKIPDLDAKTEDYYISLLYDVQKNYSIIRTREKLANVSALLDSDYNEAVNRLSSVLKHDLSVTQNTKISPDDVFSLKTSIIPIYKNIRESGGYMLGIQQYDDHIRGIKKGTLTTVFGFTGSFKTSFAVSSIYYNIMVLRLNIAMYTLEVPKYYIKYMLLSRHSLHPKFKGILDPIPYKDIYDCVLTPLQEEHLALLEEDLANSQNGQLFLFDVNDFHVSRFEDYLLALDVPLDAFVLDYIQQVGYQGDVLSKVAYINQYTKRIHDFAQVYNDGTGLVALILSQANRDGYTYACKHNGKYTLTALSEGSEQERSSFYCFALYSTQALVSQQLLSCQLLKFRGGPILPEPIKIYIDPRFVVVGDLVKTNYEDIIDGLV